MCFSFQLLTKILSERPQDSGQIAGVKGETPAMKATPQKSLKMPQTRLLKWRQIMPWTFYSKTRPKEVSQPPYSLEEVVGNRLRYQLILCQIKHAFEDYHFVRGKSGVGWDDEAKMANAEDDFVKTFIESLDNEPIDIDSDTAPKHELLPTSAKRPRTSNTTIDIISDDDENNDQPKKKKAGGRNHDRSASASSSSGGRRGLRNAETGNQIARGLKMIGEGMSAPFITKADTSHVDAIVDAFIADPTQLPEDPDGEYYALLLDALSANEMRARVFIKTQDRIQRIALLKRVLREKEMDVPVNWV
ncbi:hypothetical protein K438DRAFT_2151341 [Mycena galopus ATCC 62051]|nr:hypothetical protein K438DRAFT_2151341 [Mycena galopus ATCC 62051]